jgi:hypothetical protein
MTLQQELENKGVELLKLQVVVEETRKSPSIVVV